MMWKFWKKDRIAEIRITFDKSGTSHVKMNFQSEVAGWKQREIKQLDMYFQHSMGACVHAMMQQAQDFAFMLGADKSDLEAHLRDAKRKDLN